MLSSPLRLGLAPLPPHQGRPECQPAGCEFGLRCCSTHSCLCTCSTRICSGKCRNSFGKSASMRSGSLCACSVLQQVLSPAMGRRRPGRWLATAIADACMTLPQLRPAADQVAQNAEPLAERAIRDGVRPAVEAVAANAEPMTKQVTDGQIRPAAKRVRLTARLGLAAHQARCAARLAAASRPPAD